nr:hypothetical protein [Tanacetum cinerariifolium]
MPLSTYLNKGLGELAHTKLTVESADRTVKYPKGIAKNVLVGIGKFVFPVDFIILDMPEDINVPLILERPFFSTAHAKIDVFKRKITLRVGDEKIIVKIVEDMDPYLDEGIGDVIVGKPFYKTSCVEAKRKLFKTPSLDESSSPEFDLFSDLEEHVDEKVAGTMMKTMEEYMCKTRCDYGSGRSDNEDANEHIEHVLEIVDLFHIPNITQDRIMLRAFPMSLTGAASRWLRNKPSGSITTWEDLKTKCLNKYCPPAQTAKKMEEINNFQKEPDETLYQAWKRFKEHYLTDMQEVILFYNWLEVPTRQILIPKVLYQLRQLPMQKLATIQAQLNNLGKEIKKVNEKVYAAQVRCELCKGPHYTKDCLLKEEGKPLKKHIIFNLVYLSNKKGTIEQQLWDSTKGIMQTLRIKSETINGRTTNKVYE